MGSDLSYEWSDGVAVHVAIVVRPYDRLIVAGLKTIECRLTKSAMPPFGCITPGERIYFKLSGGAFFATAVADRVWMADRLDAAGVEGIRRQFDKQIQGAAAYWAGRREARYATLVWLREVEASTLHPRYKAQNMRAWYTLAAGADPLAGRSDQAADESAFCVKLTAGSLRQRQVRLAGVIDRFPVDALGGRTRRDVGRSIVLHLAGGGRVETDIVAHQKMFRWRGWRAWFARHGLHSGDQVRFTPRGGRRFAVEPVHATRPAKPA